MEFCKIKYGEYYRYYSLFIGCNIPEIGFNGIGFNGTSTTLAHEVGHVLGLPHPFIKCGGDITCLEDTRYDTIPSGLHGYKNTYCATGYIFRKSRSIMDYGGTYEGFTYNECERMRHVLEFAPMIRSLKSSNK